MSKARVQSTDAIRAFRPALLTFVDTSRCALDEIRTSFQRTVDWLRGEQRDHWKHEIHRRTEAVTQAKDALRRKQIFLDASGARPSAVDEKQALQRAQRQLAEARQKLEATERWSRSLEKQVLEYKANTQSLAQVLEHDVPVAVARLDRLLTTLADYTAEPHATTEPVLEAPFTEEDSDA